MKCQSKVFLLGGATHILWLPPQSSLTNRWRQTAPPPSQWISSSLSRAMGIVLLRKMPPETVFWNLAFQGYRIKGLHCFLQTTFMICGTCWTKTKSEICLVLNKTKRVCDKKPLPFEMQSRNGGGKTRAQRAGKEKCVSWGKHRPLKKLTRSGLCRKLWTPSPPYSKLWFCLLVCFSADYQVRFRN